VFGGSDQDILRGGSGNDFIDGGAGNDDVFGGDGRDVLLGGANNDRVFGNAGIDQLYGGFGDDTLFAGAGEDVSLPGGGTQHSLVGQRMWGGDDVDSLYGYSVTGNDDLPAARDAELPLIGDEMHGGSGGDFLYGNLRSEFMTGDNGNDTLLGDWLAGPGSGEDGLPVQNHNKSTVGGNDRLYGGSGEDNLTGGGGNDELYGGADSDRLEGQDGVDSLYGGDWIDKLVMDVNPAYRVQGSADHLDGHGPAAPGVFTEDDHATDILIIEGDADQQLGDIASVDDHILLGQDGNGQLIVSYNGRILEARWLDGFSTPLVEQFEVDGLQGDDTLTFITEPMTVALPGGGSLVIRPLDVSRLAGRNDFVGVLNGGPGNDILSGSPVRDRLDGASGNDTLYGFAGDDRLFGGSDGSANDHDVLFAGQGNDDLVGGSGTNELYAWTRDPKTGAQFGLFVNENGELVTDNGDLDGDDLLDSDGVSKPYQPENTGLNRMLGSQYEDDMYGGTGLDFIYGNGGNDRTFRSDGTEFNSSDQDLGGESWIAYARSNSGVWYIGGTDRADEIRLNYVTEDGILSGRHVVTRSTSIIDLNGVPRNTFSVEANLDFNGKDADGNLIWNPSGLVYNPATNSFFDDTNTIASLLPPEQPVQAVIIDARGGDDTVIVGETVQATVWVSAGAGNDYVHIRSGNALLPDASEVDRRNDSTANAFELQQPQLPAVLLGNVDAPANGVLDAASSFTLKIDDNAPVAVAIPLAAIQGEDGSFANENIDDLIYDLNGALKVAGLGTQVTATRQGNRIMLVSTNRGDAATLRIRASASDPIIRQLGFVNDFEAQGTSATSRFAYEDLTIDSNSDQDFYRLSLGQTTGSNAAVTLTSSAATDGLTMSLYAQGEGGSVSLIGTNPDTWDAGAESNNTRATAKVLTGIDQLVGITGLSLHNSADQDFFKFTTTRTGIRTDSISVRQTDGDQPLNLILTNAAGVSIPGTIRANSGGKIHQFSLDTLPAGDYWLQVTSEGAARYELVPNIGNVGSTLINLNQHVSTTISIGDQPEGTYFLKVASPNQLPTVYNLAFDLDLPDGILVPAQDLANSSFKVVRRDVITGDAGNDVLIGGLGEDWIFGGDGNDLISGGLDQQASDLLFGGAGSDTMQLFPDQLPTLEGTNTTFVPTYSDRFDGGTGEDRILYLGGDYTTDPATGAVEAIPDYVSVRYNTQLHRYEFTALRYDVANNHFEVAPNGTQYAQYYQFFQAQNVEELVIDVQAGDDVVRADAEYKFPGTDSEWGIKRGNAQQGGTLALTIEGGDGNDILYGGDQSDIIDGGDGADIIVGGNGDDLLFGGGGNDKIAGYHDGSRTPADTFDDISVPQLALPGNLAANRSPAVYRALPIGATALLQDRAPRVTVQSGDSIGDATTLHTSTTGELLIGVTAVGDLNADGFADFVVTSSLTHYVFFGPVDLSALDLVAGMTSVDAYDLAGRADVLISASVGKLVGGPVNVNGDDVRGDRVAVTGAAAVNDLLFVGQNGTTATISVLFGGAAIRDGQADTFWPRQIRSLQDLDSFNWRTVFVTLPVSTPVTTSLFDEDGDGATDLLLSSDYKAGLKSAITISGRSIVGPDTTGTVTGQTLTPTTTYWLPVSTVGGTTPSAKIY
ncbi:MAG: hypothetical protein KDA89_09955, partial [Planctomycetaceae bacterium]|nr:hypothetical protein [Planctomycetaceae bacterium]